MKLILSATLALAIIGNAAFADDAPVLNRVDLASLLDCSGKITRTLEQCARDAVADNPAVAQSAIRELRGRGPEGLRALLEMHAATLKRHETNPVLALVKVKPDESLLRLRTALDGVSGQRDCHASKLYWYTDFEQAKVAARAMAKPVLSLRLLGKLDEEFSCANSRFFRTTLYANAEIARYLNENFVLHWKSVRPVPRVTIDFGDGRKLERTLTGNSIHYVLDDQGRVIDALPGLYGPQAFLRELRRIAEITQTLAKLSGEPREQALREFHRVRFEALNKEYAADLQRIAAAPPQPVFVLAKDKTESSPPTARVAGKLAVGKGAVEMPILRRSASEQEDELWQRIGALHAEQARVDDASRALIREKSPSALAAGRLTGGKAYVEDPVIRQIRRLERSISEDTARNEYLLHTRIHDWLANNTAPSNVDELNKKVYAELFLTPDSDPWLGLAPEDAFAALENGGIVSNKP